MFWPFTVPHRYRVMFKMTHKMVIGPPLLKVVKIKFCTIFLPLALCVFNQIVLVISNVLQILGIQPQIFHSSLEQLSNIIFYPLDSWNTKKLRKTPKNKMSSFHKQQSYFSPNNNIFFYEKFQKYQYHFGF